MSHPNMHMFWWKWSPIAIYFVAQGGALSNANTIYFWPTLSLSQEETTGFEFPNGITYRWILGSSWLFWTVGIVW